MKTLALVLVGAVLTLAAVGTWRWASAVGPDVNDDGTVNLTDIFQVATSFGQSVPTPTPFSITTYVVSATPLPAGNQAFAPCDAGDHVAGGGRTGDISFLRLEPTVVVGSEGWVATSSAQGDFTVHAVCIDNPPLRE